ncbi:hypothetical protein OGAPHI_005468 [Ogataea philodendri]|uniref:Uncharacterized protein n=1 Tax=Ogataea philodendri TaxID=1378263 RepID=A0A9P8NYT3_9ASCO|nr:uncharacterized protein OGAPHI_005468 [Ogataea philodendri]KAH3662220.1 hypothetical protein OGAPHI_005468 [Ogataea philodendri]
MRLVNFISYTDQILVVWSREAVAIPSPSGDILILLTESRCPSSVPMIVPMTQSQTTTDEYSAYDANSNLPDFEKSIESTPGLSKAATIDDFVLSFIDEAESSTTCSSGLYERKC